MSLFSLVLSVYAAGVTLCLGVSVARNRALRREHASSVQKVQKLGASIARMVAKSDEVSRAVSEVFPVEHHEPPPALVACTDETGATLITASGPGEIVSSQPIRWAILEVLWLMVEVLPLSVSCGLSSLEGMEYRRVSHGSATEWFVVKGGEERYPKKFFYHMPLSTLGPEDRIQVRLPFIPGLRYKVFVGARVQRG